MIRTLTCFGKNAIIVFFCVFGFLRAESDTNNIDPVRLSIAGGLSAGLFVYGQASNYDLYWGNPSAFHVMSMEQEYDDALLADKFGHLFASYGLADIYKEVFEWSGFTTENSLIYGGCVSLFYQAYVEINDGFSGGEPYLGFSWGDIAADITGAALPYLLYEAGIYEDAGLKVSFQKAPDFSKEKANSVLNDYASTYHWLSVNTNALIPEAWENGILDYINVALGHSVKGIDRHGSGNHELYLSLDWNLRKIETGIEILDRIIDIIGLYKLPAPAARFYPSLQWYGLKF